MTEVTINPEVVVRLKSLQNRCVECGGTCKLEVHHRIFRSEGEMVLQKHLWEIVDDYVKSYNKPFLDFWSIHDIQNLCILCKKCHDALHRGNEELRQKHRNEFTEPITGFCIPFQKTKSLY